MHRATANPCIQSMPASARDLHTDPLASWTGSKHFSLFFSHQHQFGVLFRIEEGSNHRLQINLLCVVSVGFGKEDKETFPWSHKKQRAGSSPSLVAQDVGFGRRDTKVEALRWTHVTCHTSQIDTKQLQHTNSCIFHSSPYSYFPISPLSIKVTQPSPAPQMPPLIHQLRASYLTKTQPPKASWGQKLRDASTLWAPTL